MLARRLVGLLAATLITTPVALTGTAVGAPAKEAAPKAPKTHTVGVGSNPYDVAVSQSLGEAFVVNDGSVSVVSLITHRQIAEFSTNGYQGQNAIALVQNNIQGYITNYQKNTVTVFDTETRKVLKQIKVGTGAVDVAKANTPCGQRAYVALLRSNQLIGIKTSSGKVVQHIKLAHGPQTLTTAPGGKTVWAGSSYDAHVYLADTRTGKVTKSLNVGPVGPVTSIAFAPGGTRVWIAGLGGVGIFDTHTYKRITFLPILKLFTSPAPNMGSLALTGTGRYAYVENSTFPEHPTKGQLAMIDTKTHKVLHHITTGTEPETFALDTARGTAYVPNYADDTLTYFATPK